MPEGNGSIFEHHHDGPRLEPLVDRGRATRLPESVLVPRNELSEREEWALRLVGQGAWATAEYRELMDFLGYPDPMPTVQGGDLVVAVVRRILEARARGEHIA